ncbi:MAG: response regulator transcription factor [Lachnospiraceae bacterium]|nr:response regulator transcription factor [Lachnospiraceae bacterium]
MYHIGICDDDPVFIEYIKRLFNEACSEIEFYEYLSGEDLIKELEFKEQFDLLVLDVCMPGMDGNETARKFRKLFPESLLVFCSGVYMPTVESFETMPYRYWLKEYNEEKLYKEVQTVLEKLEKIKVAPCVMGKKYKQLERLELDKILYIAIARKGSVIYCENSGETYISEKKVGELYESLKDFGFAYAHNSYIVNLRHVAIAEPTQLEFLNGEKLSVSRARSKEFLKSFAIEVAKKYAEELP